MLHPARLTIEQLLTQCDVQRTRASGPGGQHRNKVETAIVIIHRPTNIRGEASERRNQEQNRQQAIFRLRVKLALQIRNAPEPTVSDLWTNRVRGQRISVSGSHEDFPALLSEVLDSLAAEEFQLPIVAEEFGITKSQLIKFLKIEPAALALVNRERVERGDSVLK